MLKTIGCSPLTAKLKFKFNRVSYCPPLFRLHRCFRLFWRLKVGGALMKIRSNAPNSFNFKESQLWLVPESGRCHSNISCVPIAYILIVFFFFNGLFCTNRKWCNTSADWTSNCSLGKPQPITKMCFQRFDDIFTIFLCHRVVSLPIFFLCPICFDILQLWAAQYSTLKETVYACRLFGV